MKLLVLTPEYLPTSGGGIVTFYRHLLPACVREGVQVTVLVGSSVSQPGGDATIDGVRVLGLEPSWFAQALARFAHLAAFPALARHLAAAWAMHAQAAAIGAFDVVEAVDWGLPAVPWILRGDAPVVVRGHGSAGQIAQHEPRLDEAPFEALLLAIERSVFARASVIATYSPANAAAWRALLPRAVTFVPPAVPVADAVATAHAPEALVLARVQPWKGPHVLGAALDRDPSLPTVRWVGRDVPDAAHGGASTLARMREQFASWRTRIDQRATVDAALALAWCREARFVVVPSTWDVFNFAGAEAMAVGAVLVVSEGAGVAGLIEDGRNGFSVPAGDAPALADAMRRAHALDATARARIGAAARETVRATLDPVTVARENIALWSQAERVAPVSDAIDAVLEPRDGAPSRHAFLAQYGLRDLVRHVGARLRDKVTRR